MKLWTLTLRYIIFAIIAMLTNIAMQRIILHIDDSRFYFFIAILLGTIAGLIVKYELDRRWIFYDHSIGIKNHGYKISLYALMGIFTTAIFWGTETSFWLIWQTNNMRELGAVVGLMFGYILKYNLDRRYVFAQKTSRALS